MAFQNIFERYEIKYMINRRQMEYLLQIMQHRMMPDEYGRSTICNIYYDTPSHLLIRRSLEKPVYKEKLRMRSYGPATPNSKVFVELKKKYRSIVYKRRIAMDEATAAAYLRREVPASDTQIAREIEYFLDFYSPLAPAMYLCYDREAFYERDGSGFRITFDTNIRWREDNLSLCSEPIGNALLPSDAVIMEVKTAAGVPLWLSKTLSEQKIYKTPFSKYGTAYTRTLVKE